MVSPFLSPATGGSIADPPALGVQDLCYRVASRVVLDGISFDLASGESLSITGPSGSGKTTLLMCLAGLFTATSGGVQISGTTLGELSQRRRSALRLNRIGIVYQFGELMPELTPLENVALPAMLNRVPRPVAEDRAGDLLYQLDIAELAYQATPTLSGGERQRVAVARALVLKPAVLLADEPTGSLDRAATDQVARLLFEMPRRYGCALVVATHNPAVARRADRWSELRDGRLRGTGP